MGIYSILFAKKPPPSLNRGIKSRVNEVYSNTYPRVPLPSSASGPRSRKWLKIGHVTFHTIPTQLGFASLLFWSGVWCAYYPVQTKIISAAGALAYTAAESAFTYFERGKEAGGTHAGGRGERGREGGGGRAERLNDRQHTFHHYYN